MMIHDPSFGEKLYKEYHPKVLGYIINRIGDRSAAEELASAVFLKVFKNIQSFDDNKSSLSTWIYNITRNTLIDHYRGARAVMPLSEIMISSDDIVGDIIHSECLEALAAALENLDGRARDIIVLHYYRGKSLSEICSYMNISYSYAKVLHKKAIEELKTLLR